MALETQVVSLPLAQGMNTKTDPKQVQIGEVLLMQNAIFQSTDRIEKRNGYSALSQAVVNSSPVASLSTGNALGTLNNQIVCYNGEGVYTYSAVDQQWGRAGNWTPVGVTSTQLAYQASGNNRGYARATNGLELYATNASGGIQYFIRDSATGSTIYSNTVALSAALLAVPTVYASGKFYALYSDGVNRVYALVISASAPTSSPTSVLLQTFGSTTSITALTAITSGTLLIVGTGYTTTLTNPRRFAVNSYDTSASYAPVASSTAVGLSAVPTAASISYDTVNSVYWYGFIAGTTVELFAFNTSGGLASYPTFSTTNASTASVQVIAQNGTCYVFFDNYVTRTFNALSSIINYISAGTATTSAAGTVIAYQYQAQIGSTPFIGPDGAVYILAAYVTSAALQNVYFVLKNYASSGLSYGSVVAKVGTSFVTGFSVQFGVNNVVQTSSSTFNFPYFSTVPGGFENDGSTQATTKSYQLATLTFGVKTRTLALANTLHACAGYIASFDGITQAEHGFHLFPENFQAATTTSSTATYLSVGTYAVTCVYVWVDSLGQVYRSAPAPAITINIASANTTNIDMCVPNLSIADKVTSVEFYATAPNGTTYYLIDPLGVTTVPGVTPSAQTGQLSGRHFEKDITQFTSTPTILYTSGGEVEDVEPPAVSSMASFKNRIFAVTSENQQQLWYSKQVLQGSPVEFSDLFTLALDQKGGGCTAVAAMDDKLVIFKQSAIFYIVGDGPSPAGTNNDFIYPQNVPTDCGCNNPDSVVLTPAGLMFQGSKGIYLLDRSLSVKYIGAQVEAYNAFTITSAYIVSNTTQVRFTLNTGVWLVYDYLVGKWSIFTPNQAVDATLINGTYTYLTASGLVLQETIGTYLDVANAISMSLTTGWLSFGKVQGFQRMRKLLILGDYFSANTLSVSFAYDFNPAITQTVPVVADTRTPYQWMVQPARQKCESVQLTITENPTAPYGQGLSLSNLALEIGVKAGTQKVPEFRSTG